MKPYISKLVALLFFLQIYQSHCQISPGFNIVTVQSFEYPTSFIANGPNIFFVTQKNGEVYRLNGAAKSLILDLKNEVFMDGDLGLFTIVLDPNFGSNGYLNNIFAQFLNGEVLSIKVTGNEKTFIVGLIAYDTTLNHNVQIGKLNSNGSLDSSFGKNGYYSEKNDSSTTFLKDIDLDNNGKIIASGSYNDTLFNSFQIIKRLLPDGSLDSSFGKNGVLLIPKELLTVILGHKTLLNGKILTYNLNNYDSYVNRYNNNGTLDSTFADKGQLIIPNLSQNSSSRSRTYFLVQNDNKILVFGENQTDNQLEVHRFTPNGQIDKTYGKNGKNTLKLGNAYLTNSNMMLDEQGRVIISGSGVGKVTSTSPPTSQFFLARFKADKNSINTKEYSAPLPIKIYPNPGNDLLNIETNIELTEATIDFYDLLGKRVFTSSLKTNEKTIDTHLWKSGVYFYQISSQRKIVSSGKWIKM